MFIHHSPGIFQFLSTFKTTDFKYLSSKLNIWGFQGTILVNFFFSVNGTYFSSLHCSPFFVVVENWTALVYYNVETPKIRFFPLFRVCYLLLKTDMFCLSLVTFPRHFVKTIFSPCVMTELSVLLCQWTEIFINAWSQGE